MLYKQLLMIMATTVTLYAQTLPVKRIAIGKGDTEHLGGWPLARRWYAVAIQQMKQAGAKAIYVDLAFPTSDPMHPESDEMFYEECIADPTVFMLGSPSQTPTILGNKPFPRERIFMPFSESWRFSGNEVESISSNVSLSSLILGHTVPEGLMVPLPVHTLSPDMSLTEFLGTNPEVSGCVVILYADLPGVTSYIAAENGVISSVTELQIWIAGQIQTGHYFYRWPVWIILTLFLLCSFWTSIAIISQKRIVLYTGLALCLAIPAALYFFRIFIPIWTWWSFAPIVLAFIFSLINRRKEPDRVSMAAGESAAYGDDLQDLRYRLKFYERLSDQLKPLDLKECREAQGIIFHKDSPFAELLHKADQIASSDVPVLIMGESGTGKEKIAEFIHRRSPRSSGPFVAVNCGAVNENLIEAELFGYEKGAFTGAVTSKPGRFEAAHNGTLFLDEIAETNPAFQVKLLRVIQEGRFEPVGSVSTRSVSVRIITATNRDLSALVREGTFREDLYYRIAGFILQVKPLRERQDDIAVLFKQFLFDSAPDLKYSDHLIQWLMEQEWPGNVRQLRTAIQRSVINARMRNRSFILPADFEIESASKPLSEQALADRVLEALRRENFKHRAMSAVADQLGLHRLTVAEYFRGWMIRAMALYPSDEKAMLRFLAGSQHPEEREALVKRMNEYKKTIIERIQAGIRQEESPEMIIRLRFKNTPGFFYDDLIQLIGAQRHV